MPTRDQPAPATKPRSRAVPLIAAISGAVSGAVISIVAGSVAGHDRSPPARASEPTGRAALPAPASPASPALGSLRNDVSRMEQRVERLEQSEPAGDPPSPPPEAPPASFYHERHDEAIRRHDAEPVDRAWGPQTATVVRSDIEKLAPRGQFQVANVDCRTATCTAVLRWPSREVAVTGYRWLLLFPLRANCERTIVLPEPTAGGGDIQATLLLDCNSWRAGGSQLLPEDSMPPLPVASLENSAGTALPGSATR